jgi:hypothetical protein
MIEDATKGGGAGGSPKKVSEDDRSIKERDSNPVPGTAENERAATRGEDAPDPVAEGLPQHGVRGKGQPRR